MGWWAKWNPTRLTTGAAAVAPFFIPPNFEAGGAERKGHGTCATNSVCGLAFFKSEIWRVKILTCQIDDTMNHVPCAMIHEPLTLTGETNMNNHYNRTKPRAFESGLFFYGRPWQARGAGWARKAQRSKAFEPWTMVFWQTRGAGLTRKWI